MWTLIPNSRLKIFSLPTLALKSPNRRAPLIVKFNFPSLLAHSFTHNSINLIPNMGTDGRGGVKGK